MAKPKSARAARRKTAGKRARPNQARSRAGRPARKKGARRRSPARRTRAAARKGGTRKAVPKRAARKVAARKVARKANKAISRKAAARKTPSKVATAVKVAKVVKPRPAARTSASSRRVPALDRERRVFRDDDLLPSPPSSLDLDRTASAARTGRREMAEKFHHHTETSPALTGGDIDADWEGAYATGDEAPGGDNPTPDESIVDDIGKAIGVQYEDNEELKGEKKISDRDKKRWELDPASAEDYDDR